MSWEVIDHFVDIGGIVDHYCLNFLFIIYLIMFWSPKLCYDGKHFDTNNLPWRTQSRQNLIYNDFNRTSTMDTTLYQGMEPEINRLSRRNLVFMQSVPITTKVVGPNPAHGEVYSIQQYVIKFVSDLRQVSVNRLLIYRQTWTN